MATLPTDDIEFATDSDAPMDEPDTAEKLHGWDPGEEPPAEWFNWFQRAYWRWIKFFQDILSADSHGTIAITGNGTATRAAVTVVSGNDKIGIDVTGSTSSALGPAIKATGELAVKAISTDGQGIATWGQIPFSAGNVGIAVYGESLGNGTGVFGISANGYGVVAAGDTTSPTTSAFHITPQDTAPSGPNNIGDIYVSSAGILFICTANGTPGTWTKVGTQT